MGTEILTARTTAGTSDPFTITSGVSLQIPLLTSTEFCVLEYQYNGSGAWYPVTSVGKEGRLDPKVMPKLLVGPGTYRIKKPITDKAVAIAYEE